MNPNSVKMNREEALIWMVQNPGKEVHDAENCRILFKYEEGRFYIGGEDHYGGVSWDPYTNKYTNKHSGTGFKDIKYVRSRKSCTVSEAMILLANGKNVWLENRKVQLSSDGISVDGKGMSLSFDAASNWFAEPPFSE